MDYEKIISSFIYQELVVQFLLHQLIFQFNVILYQLHQHALSDVQQCLVEKQKTSRSLYEVKFKDNNQHTYTCKFAANTPTEQINSCED